MKQECHKQPVCIDLFCGLFGWGESFAQTGFRVVGFDIEDQFKNFGKTMPENCELVLRDIRSINGADLVRQYGVPAVIVASPPCFPAGTLILTKSRLVPIEQIRVGDEVFTHRGRWRRVVSTMNRIGNTIIAKGQGGPLEGTPEHPVFARKSAQWKSCWDKHSKKTKNRKIEMGEPIWNPLAKMENHHWATPNKFPSLPIPEIPHKLNPSENFWWMVGRWLGDGWTRKRGNTGAIIICCAKHETDELKYKLSTVAPIKESKLRRSANGGELNWSVSKQRTTSRFETWSGKLSDWFDREFGRGASYKNLPSWVFGMPQSWKIALLSGYLSSDGCVVMNNGMMENKISTVSKSLAFGIRLLAESLGYTTGLYFTRRPAKCTIEGRIVNQKHSWQVVWKPTQTRHVPLKHRSGAITWNCVRSIESGRSDVEVFNLEVDEDNSYTADGRIVHNCQEFSYMAMPWGKAKEKRKAILVSDAEKKRLCELFNECFRIQREVSAAAGCYVPMVVENVRGAQEWVGRSNYNFGSFHLWGDVPALMPQPQKFKLKTTGPVTERQAKNHNCHINEMRDVLKGEGNKTVGMNWSDQSKRGQDFTRIAGQQMEGVKVASETGRRTDKGKGARFTSRDCGAEGIKTGGDWRDMECRKTSSAQFGSKSKARKEASALIAKIPPVLASWIAWHFKPKTTPDPL